MVCYTGHRGGLPFRLLVNVSLQVPQWAGVFQARLCRAVLGCGRTGQAAV